MGRPKRGQIEIEGRTAVCLRAEVDSRDRIKLPDVVWSVTGWLKEKPSELVFRLLAPGQVSCMLPTDKLIDQIKEALLSSDDELVEATAVSFFEGAIYSKENRVTLPDEVIGFLGKTGAADAEYWILAKAGSLEIWNDQFHSERQRIAAKAADAILRGA